MCFYFKRRPLLDSDDYLEEPELIFPTNPAEKKFYFIEEIKKLSAFINNIDQKIMPPKQQFKNQLMIKNKLYKTRFIDRSEPLKPCQVGFPKNYLTQMFQIK